MNTMKRNKTKFWNPSEILSKQAQYNVVFGERSNGKTYAILKLALENFAKDGSQLAIVRRWSEDFVGKRGQTMFDSLVTNNEVAKITKGEWTNVYYWGSRWYLCRYEDDKRITCETPFAYGFSISSMEHDKSTSYPHITLIMFDEFITRSKGGYLPDEFVLFMNTLSTIIRQRKNVVIFMLGNTVNKFNPYFSEMGLNHAKDMKQGSIDVYTYGDSELRVAVEYCASSSNSKESDLYFAFDNPRLNMVKSGTWEIDIYPHCPVKYSPKHIMFTYFIVFNNEILQCEIVQKDNSMFTFIHRKTTPLKDTNTDLIYSTEYDMRPNHKRKITKPMSDIERKIAEFFKSEKVYYQDNEVGEVIRNYLIWCNTN